MKDKWFNENPSSFIPHPSSFEDYAAIVLFLQTAQRVQTNFAFEPEQPGIVRICQLVEGMPLAIELAGAAVRQIPCDALAAQIERNLDILATTMRDVPARHRSIRAAFDHSWNLLTEEERRAFRRLAVFRGGFDGEAAESVASDECRVTGDTPLATRHPSPVTLSTLVDKSLLRERDGAV